MWIYILIGLLVIYALYKERQALGCRGFLDTSGKDCDNVNGKAVKGTKPLSTDLAIDLCDKIELAASYHDRFVKWRAIFLFSVLTTLVLWFLLYRKIPSEWDMVVSIITLMLLSMLSLGFYKFHLEDHIKRNIISSISKLKEKYFS